MLLEGQVAIVTAAGRGIGRGIALALANAGAHVAVNSFSPEKTEETAALVEAQGVRALRQVADITQPEQMVALVDATVAEFGCADILVNNVGASPRTTEQPVEGPLGPAATFWDAMYDQNLRAAVLMCEAIIPHFVQRKSGKIINISSIAGKDALTDKFLENFAPPAYGAMKAALSHHTAMLAETLGPHNINVNAVCPGIIYTDAWKGNAERAVKRIDEFAGRDARDWFEGIARGDYPHYFSPTPLRREQTVEDIGNAVVFLASSMAANVTGQSLMVDGGMVKV